MVIVQNGVRIKYAIGDTFKLNVRVNDFPEAQSIRFQIAKNGVRDIVINKSVTIENMEEPTLIKLTSQEASLLETNNYVYRITLIDSESNILTVKSGDLVVEWGVN